MLAKRSIIMSGAVKKQDVTVDALDRIDEFLESVKVLDQSEEGSEALQGLTWSESSE
jgi:hypothetical protein